MKKLLIALLLLAGPAQAQTNLLPTVTALRSEYPAKMTPAQVGELMNRIAWQHRADGWGLLKKTGGTRCLAPHDVEISCDILIHMPSVTHFDVLADTENAATPVWRPVGPCVLGPTSGCSMSNFLAPIQPAGTPTPAPTPAPAPAPAPDPNIPRLFEQIRNLTQTVEALRQWAESRLAAEHEKHEVLTSRATTLEHRVDLVEQRPAPEYGCRGYLNLIIFRVPIAACEVKALNR